jgi:transcription elongation factor GreB
VSKAFTREDDGATPEATPVGPAPLAPGEVRYLTPEGATKLRAELERLEQERAPDSASTASTAPAAEGARRARQIEAVLASATVAALDPAQDRVLFGAWVTLEDEAGERTAFRIVGPDEVDARAQQVSANSPLARAALGRRAGDEVFVDRPRGGATYTIVSVRYR